MDDKTAWVWVEKKLVDYARLVSDKDASLLLQAELHFLHLPSQRFEGYTNFACKVCVYNCAVP